MPTSPASHEAFAKEIRRIYADAENIMLQKVARRLERGIDSPGWAEDKLAQVQAMRSEIAAEIAILRQTDPELAKAIEAAYRGGAAEAVVDLGAVMEHGAIDTAFGTISRGKVEAIAREAVAAVNSTHLRILRVTEDAYRDVIAQTTSQVLTGTQIRRQAAQAALNLFAEKGIAGYVDKAGRNWDMASYAEMATRTASGRAAVQGHIDKLTDNGRDLVIVSVSPETCPVCDPWENQVLSIGGQSRDHANVADATEAGLFHANCTHNLSLYVPGLTTPAPRLPKEQRQEAYEERQQQRYLERGIRQWKNREAVSINIWDRGHAEAKVKEWQARQREFIASTGRARDYGRESVTRAR